MPPAAVPSPDSLPNTAAARVPKHARIAAVPLFRDLAPAAVRALADLGVVRRYGLGEVLWAAGAEAGGLAVVLVGRVRVVRSTRGRQHTVHEEGPGGTLGDVPFFDGGRYPATALAAAPTTCLVLGRDALRRAVAADPELALRLLGRLAARVRGLVDRLDGRTTRSVEQRLAAHLLALDAAASGTAFPIGPSQAVVAEELGTVREVLVRALRRLREAGVLDVAARGRYRVRDAGRLRQLAA